MCNVEEVGVYIVNHSATVRDAAARFGYSKTYVHHCLTTRLRAIDPVLYQQVRDVMDYHTYIRHLRGGEATKIKYKARS